MGAPTVLVGWDGSEHAEHALAWAARYARQTGGGLVLVHVVPPSALQPAASGLSPDLVEDERGAHEAALQDELRDAARRYELDAAIELIPSPFPAEALLEAAQRHDASLMCLGARGKGAVATLLLGSVADRVARHSELPVVLVR
jgi:nucleotide-binding universal stress UspA family protein